MPNYILLVQHHFQDYCKISGRLACNLQIYESTTTMKKKIRSIFWLFKVTGFCINWPYTIVFRWQAIQIARKSGKKQKEKMRKVRWERWTEERKYRRKEMDGWFHQIWILWWNHGKKVWGKWEEEGWSARKGRKQGREGVRGERESWNSSKFLHF